MGRGGARKGAGVKPTWKHGKTKTIRVPVALADQILEFARELDNNGLIESVSDSNMVNLSGISVFSVRGKTAVLLQDLVKAGYQIKPGQLADKVIDEIYKSQLSQADRGFTRSAKKN